MAKLLNSLKGPYFSFLVLQPGEYWKRAGKVQRIIGIKPEYYHHPDALRIPDAIIGIVVDAFARANARFNYHGPTEYQGKNLDRLHAGLREWSGLAGSIGGFVDFRGLLTELFILRCSRDIADWEEQWSTIRDELVELITKVADLACTARDRGDVLLVLGV
jgi:hypothetical protein